MNASCGTWTSPLSAAAVASNALRLEVVACDGDAVYWLEGRPAEQGRYVLVRRVGSAAPADVTPPGVNVRTRVHEYGGGGCLIASGIVYYSEFSDQRLYRLVPGETPRPLTPPGAWRYADAAMHPSGRWLLCVREDHSSPGEAATTIVRLSANGDASEGEVVVSGHDFYSTPRISPDGTRACWLAWNHPQMPWDGTELWVADVSSDGQLHAERMIAGGPQESIFQPGWSPDGRLYFVSDWTGWWNLYRESAGTTEALCPLNAEFGRPQWAFGASTWAFADASRLVVSFRDADGWHIGTLDTGSGDLRVLPVDLDPGSVMLATATHAVTAAGSPDAPDAIVRIELSSGAVDIVRTASSRALEPEFLSRAEPIEFSAGDGQAAHALFYAPRNPEFQPLDRERPPVIVVSHGGPTAAATARLNLEIQYWTTRGIAVVDVDYGGSTGYGRAYRERLNGQWGIVDVADCVAAAAHLAEAGRVDPARLIIRGRSAGGYTTLAALAFRPEVFAAGTSYYGVSDLEALARDTHKFESRYMDRLIGPYPEARDVYRQRSPIHAVDRIACPLILLQGMDDRVVPPNQAELMAAAVRAKGLPVTLVLLEGEQHGFRRPESIVRCLEAELAFYGNVFGFEPS